MCAVKSIESTIKDQHVVTAGAAIKRVERVALAFDRHGVVANGSGQRIGGRATLQRHCVRAGCPRQTNVACHRTARDRQLVISATNDHSTGNGVGVQQMVATRTIAIRQVKYRNNIVEQDHRAVKRVSRLLLGFKSFRCANTLLAGIEFMHMIIKGHLLGCGEIRLPQNNSIPWPMKEVSLGFLGLCSLTATEA